MNCTKIIYFLLSNFYKVVISLWGLMPLALQKLKVSIFWLLINFITEVKKTMTEEESALIRAKNEEIRKERETAADVIATKFACFKRDFMSAPIR